MPDPAFDSADYELLWPRDLFVRELTAVQATAAGRTARRERLLEAHAPRPPCSSGPPATIGVHRLPVPTGGDRAGSALVAPLWTVLMRASGLAVGQTR